jgi:hypothetical protein
MKDNSRLSKCPLFHCPLEGIAPAFRRNGPLSRGHQHGALLSAGTTVFRGANIRVQTECAGLVPDM